VGPTSARESAGLGAKPALSGAAAGIFRPLGTVDEGRLQAKPSRCRRARHAVSVLARIKRDSARTEAHRKERIWESELEPRQPLARPAEGLHTVSVLQSVDVDLDSSPGPAAQHRDWGALSPLLGRWEAVPARWKVVTATSLAFVICNMVRAPAPAFFPCDPHLGSTCCLCISPLVYDVIVPVTLPTFLDDIMSKLCTL
jgi:hypothetical protein